MTTELKLNSPVASETQATKISTIPENSSQTKLVETEAQKNVNTHSNENKEASQNNISTNNSSTANKSENKNDLNSTNNNENIHFRLETSHSNTNSNTEETSSKTLLNGDENNFSEPPFKKRKENSETVTPNEVLNETKTQIETSTVSETQKLSSNGVKKISSDIIFDIEIPEEVATNPQINCIGLFIGPGGSTQRTLEAQTGAKITVRGRGTARGIKSADSERPMFVRIQGKTQEQIDAASLVVKELLNDPDKRDALRQQQMRQRDVTYKSQFTNQNLNYNSNLNFNPNFNAQNLMPNYVPQHNLMNNQMMGMNFPSLQAQTVQNPMPTVSNHNQTLTPNLNSAQPYTGGEMIMVAATKVGLIIGRNGETIRLLQSASGATVQVQREHSVEHPETREVTIQGTTEQIAKAKDIMYKYLTGGGERLPSGPMPPENDHIMIPNNLVGIIIGRSGETIKRLQADTQCTIQVTPEVLSPQGATERRIILNGTEEQCKIAKEAINELIGKQGDSTYVFQPIGNELEIISIPSGCIGLLLGKAGECVKHMANKTHTRIQVLNEEDQLLDGSFPNPEYRNVSIKGDRSCIEDAKAQIQKIIDEHAKRHGYDPPQLSKKEELSLGTFGMEPEQYKQYIQQMQQYYGLTEKQIHEYYKKAMEQAAADPVAYQQMYAQQMAAYQSQISGMVNPSLQQQVQAQQPLTQQVQFPNMNYQQPQAQAQAQQIPNIQNTIPTQPQQFNPVQYGAMGAQQPFAQGFQNQVQQGAQYQQPHSSLQMSSMQAYPSLQNSYHQNLNVQSSNIATQQTQSFTGK